jgi:hypothetical protein
MNAQDEIRRNGRARRFEVNKVVCLDREGVIQASENRFRHLDNLEPMYLDLEKRFGDGYRQMYKYDVAAAYYDWDRASARIIKKMLDEENAGFVLPSSWDSNCADTLRRLLRICGLDSRFLGLTSKRLWGDERCHLIRAYWGGIASNRDCEILSYLVDNPSIRSFVIISGNTVRQRLLSAHSMKPEGLFSHKDHIKCLDLLSKRWPDASRKDHYARFMALATSQKAYA